MLTVEAFNAVRFADLFPGSPDLELAAGDFDTEYAGGLWGFEEVAGARMMFPQVSPQNPGTLEVEACQGSDGQRMVAGKIIRPVPDPTLTMNADTVLAALGLDIRMGASASEVVALATSPVIREEFPNDPDRKFFSFAHGPFDMDAIVSASNGLLRLEIIRRDLLQANDRGY